MKTMLCSFIAFPLLVLSASIWAQPVIEDEGVFIDLEELTRIVESWTPDMRSSAANDLGDRLELLNLVLTRKKISLQVEQLSPEDNPDTYWQYVTLLERMQRKFIFDQFNKNLVVPDMALLAQERYNTNKDKYALMPEERTSSHILFSCPPGCDREPLRPKADELLAELLAGADFEEMVAIHSQDPGTRANKGKLDRWITLGQPGIAAHYSGALFEIEEVGGYSNVTDTQFGLHIIRLDDVRESYHLPFEEVRDDIINALELEYRELATKDFQASFRMSDNVRIDGPAMDALFAPYKTLETQPEQAAEVPEEAGEQ